jgi:serine/threonine-protein kinase RsbW
MRAPHERRSDKNVEAVSTPCHAFRHLNPAAFHPSFLKVVEFAMDYGALLFVSVILVLARHLLIYMSAEELDARWREMSATNGPQPMCVEVAIPSDISRIPPLADRLMHLIELAGCVPGKEIEVEMALREALNNAVVHGNRMDPGKKINVHCRCDPGNGVSIVVRDEGNGFDPSQVPYPTPAQALYSSGKRGIYIMKFYMDEVTFEKGGTEVHLFKRAACKPIRGTCRRDKTC